MLDVKSGFTSVRVLCETTVTLRDNNDESQENNPVMSAVGLQRLVDVLQDEMAAPFRQSRCIVLQHVRENSTPENSTAGNSTRVYKVTSTRPQNHR